MFSEIGLSSVSGDNRISEWQASSDSTYLIEGSRNISCYGQQGLSVMRVPWVSGNG